MAKGSGGGGQSGRGGGVAPGSILDSSVSIKARGLISERDALVDYLQMQNKRGSAVADEVGLGRLAEIDGLLMQELGSRFESVVFAQRR